MDQYGTGFKKLENLVKADGVVTKGELALSIQKMKMSSQARENLAMVIVNRILSWWMKCEDSEWMVVVNNHFAAPDVFEKS